MKPVIVFLFAFSLTIAASAQWSEIGRGQTYSLCADYAGNIYAAGGWAGGIPSPGNRTYVAKWNGINWTPMDSNFNSIPNLDFNSICVDTFNNVFVAGQFKNSNGKCYVAKWNGTSWDEVGTGINSLAADSQIYSICFDKAGALYAAGQFTNSSGKKYVAKWDGTNWSEVGTGSNRLAANLSIRNICADTAGNLFAAGRFTNSNGKCYVAKWDGVSWNELGSGANGLNANNQIYSICADNVGNVYAGGQFKNSNNKCYVAKWNGITWGELGSVNDTLDNSSKYIDDVEKDPLGNIYASVYKTRTPYTSFYVIKWNGNSWSELTGLSTDDDITLCLDWQGNLFATGAYNPASHYYYIAEYTDAYNATYTSIRNGNWNDPATWANGLVPHAGSKVMIGHNVNVNANAICYSITMQPGGNITVASGIQLTVLH